ncbi:LRR receptor-like serine threonine-protein kinase [Musa troglodytarum]|uniref:LRR receptor-like serine threonine-protein kinase n=1 Tax=Musa troglodytarum TaxID=320322 RepID=A0A9E7E7E8_9LILI|nr:LRR receptor-like serine threonine-protein kinase [Musa troglodytarum]
MLRWLANATSLEYLLLSGCWSLTIEPLQVTLGALSNLKGLDLSYNSLEGTILGILNNVSSRGLKHFDLRWNQLSGDIPWSLRDLEYLDLSWNSNVSVRMPTLLGNFTSLRYLSLWENKLIGGEIPPIVGDFVQLEHLDLSETGITGEIPSSIGNLTNLEYLDLSYNNLSDDEKLEKLLEYTSIVAGFVVGFWLFIGTLVLKQAIRFAFFRWIDKTSDWVYVQFAIKLVKLKSKWQTIATSSADAGVKLEADDDGDMLETIILDVTSVVVGFIVVSGVSIGVVIVKQGLRITLFQQNDTTYGWMQICAAES